MRSVLGIDAGGSRTRCMIADESGAVCSFGYGGPANTNFVSLDAARTAIENALAESLGADKHPIVAAVIAGPHLPPDTPEVVSRLAETDNVVAANEFEACLAAGLKEPGGCGVALMAGTGSFCRGRNAAGAEQHTGGWGPLIGDEGGGYDIGRRALRAAAEAFDGRRGKTLMTEAILSHLRVRQADELKKVLYNPPMKRHEVARLAEIVFSAGESGDEAAAEILRRAGRHLAQLASPTITALFGAEESFPVVLSGGILTEQSIVTRVLMLELGANYPRADVFVSKLQPVTGAVIIGLHSTGVRIDSHIAGNLEKADHKMTMFVRAKENEQR